MNETPISKAIIATNSVNGTNVNTATTIPLLNIWNRNVERIFISVCPAIKLANNRTPKETALAK